MAYGKEVKIILPSGKVETRQLDVIKIEPEQKAASRKNETKELRRSNDVVHDLGRGVGKFASSFKKFSKNLVLFLIVLAINVYYGYIVVHSYLPWTETLSVGMRALTVVMMIIYSIWLFVNLDVSFYYVFICRRKDTDYVWDDMFSFSTWCWGLGFFIAPLEIAFSGTALGHMKMPFEAALTSWLVLIPAFIFSYLAHK